MKQKGFDVGLRISPMPWPLGLKHKGRLNMYTPKTYAEKMKGKRGWRRIANALGYSCHGVRFACAEPGFRQLLWLHGALMLYFMFCRLRLGREHYFGVGFVCFDIRGGIAQYRHRSGRWTTLRKSSTPLAKGAKDRRLGRAYIHARRAGNFMDYGHHRKRSHHDPRILRPTSERQKRPAPHFQCRRLFEDGFCSAYRYESAFRQLVRLNGFLLVLAFVLDFGPASRMMLITASFISLIVELVNTAIEAAVDHTSTAQHELAEARQRCRLGCANLGAGAFGAAVVDGFVARIRA